MTSLIPLCSETIPNSAKTHFVTGQHASSAMHTRVILLLAGLCVCLAGQDNTPKCQSVQDLVTLLPGVNSTVDRLKAALPVMLAGHSIRQRHQIHLKDDEARKAAEQRFGSAFYTADVLDCLYDLYKDSVADENMCKFLRDTSLPAELTDGPYFFAANLKDNEAQVPHQIMQLLSLIVDSKRSDNLFVSIYESGSTDDTGDWLEVLSILLTKLEVPYKIVVSGSIQRRTEEIRIGFLVKVRNAVLEPLLPGGPVHNVPFKKIIFANDVFFCAQHVKRLLLHDANMACGMDFAETHSEGMPGTHWVKPYGNEGPFMTDGREFSKLAYAFYDVWVARDAEGIAMANLAPYVNHAYSVLRLSRGLPIPVKCCWNGLAIFDAEPVQYGGIRFRDQVNPAECQASEISYFCEDYLRLGRNKMVMDPAVRVSYVPASWNHNLYGSHVDWIPLESWQTALNNPLEWSFSPSKAMMMCCPEIEFAKCHSRDIYTGINHTDIYLRQSQMTPDLPDPIGLEIAGVEGKTAQKAAHDQVNAAQQAAQQAATNQEAGAAQQAAQTVVRRHQQPVETSNDDVAEV